MEKLFGYFAAGDGPFYFAETLRSLRWLPVVWHAEEGFGANHGFRLWYDYPLQLFIKIFSSVGLNWWWIDKLLWLGAVVLALYCSYSFGKYFIKKPYSYLAPVVYVFNTYSLLLFSGGQLGVVWAYAYFPFVLVQFLRSLDENRGFSLTHAARRGVYLSLLMIFDLRFAYLLIGVLALYHLYYRRTHGSKGFWGSILDFGVSLCITIGVHAFWIVPTLLMGAVGVGGFDREITNPGMLRFLSFADFPHALSLLHPNWPENLFGKVYFLQQEFLVIPTIAFASLLITKLKTEGKQITFFALLALVGAFLAKGVQEPFGGVYVWAFNHVPGFVMFRDPTKFYVYIALAYSMLIPYALQFMKKKFTLYIFIVFWILTLRALFLGQVQGNVTLMQLPSEYVQLKNLLVTDTTPSRTLWIPGQEKFAYQSDIHPLLYSDQLFRSASISAVIRLTRNPDFITALADSGVRYVVVPMDLEHRLFLNDYHFDMKQRQNLIAALDKTSLHRDPRFQRIAVFENNTFIMRSTTPPTILRQDRYTLIGLGISVLAVLASFFVLLK